MRRSRLSSGHSRQVFRAAAGHHVKNDARPRRGGFRL